MNNQEIELARKKYNNLLLEKRKYEKMKQRILELKQNPSVEEYIQISNDIDEKIKLTDNEIKAKEHLENTSVITMNMGYINIKKEYDNLKEQEKQIEKEN